VRKSERIAVDEPARLHPNGWSSLEVRLLDCSAEGFRAECEARVRIGDEVTLEVPGIGPAAAWVTWLRDHEFGARFQEPVAIERAALKPAGAEAQLARLLVQRAQAHRSGLHECEEALRDRIRDALPVRKS
jgi:hypothetical protein